MPNDTLKIYRAVELKAPGIIERSSVKEPVITKTLVAASMIQTRDLVIGDRGIGKTAIGIDTITNQLHNNLMGGKNKLYSIYVALVQKRASLIQILNKLNVHKAGQLLIRTRKLIKSFIYDEKLDHFPITGHISLLLTINAIGYLLPYQHRMILTLDLFNLNPIVLGFTTTAIFVILLLLLLVAKSRLLYMVYCFINVKVISLLQSFLSMKE